MSSFPLLNAFWTMLWFFLWIIWIFLLFWVIFDIFRSRDLSGWGKAGWLILVIVLPFLGVFCYLIARGGSMHERQAADARARDDSFRAYGSAAAGGNSTAELTKLADLRDRGAITEEEFKQGKAKILS
jgi:putative oligomerization/nucleic acid binding protein/phospholipase D-like protein